MLLQDKNAIIYGGGPISGTVAQALRRQLSAEFGQHGIRVVTLRTGGVLGTIPPNLAGREALVKSLEQATMLGRTATLEDVGHVAAP
jgi:enoyl-[acyl-carrier-protein] reductase (NADH)